MSDKKLTKQQRKALDLIEQMGVVAIGDGAFVCDGRRLNIRVCQNLIRLGALIPNNGALLEGDTQTYRVQA